MPKQIMETWKLPTLDWSQLLSAAGVSWLASWLLFFVLAPILHWFLGNWKLASGVAYALSWLAMLAFFRLYVMFTDSMKTVATE